MQASDITNIISELFRPSLLTDSSNGHIVILAGAPATCKTAICNALLKEKDNLKVIQMESFFKTSRTERRNSGLNGFDEVAYDSNRIDSFIKSYCTGQKAILNEYSHGTGFTENQQVISNEYDLILEGLAFFQNNIASTSRCLAKYIFFPENLENWKSVHIKRDWEERTQKPDYKFLEEEFIKKSRSLKNWLKHVNLYETKYIKIRYGNIITHNEFIISSNSEFRKFTSCLR